jgi:uncharacterized membrane protein
MKKLISVIIAVVSCIFGAALVYFRGKKQGFEQALDNQIKQDNANLSNEVKALEKAKDIEVTTAAASDDAIIAGLRDCIPKNDNS